MADSAFQIQYRQEFIAQFEQGQSWLRSVCTTEAVIKGNQAMFLVAGSGGATAVTRGLNGSIPPRVDSLTQVPATPDRMARQAAAHRVQHLRQSGRRPPHHADVNGQGDEPQDRPRHSGDAFRRVEHARYGADHDARDSDTRAGASRPAGCRHHRGRQHVLRRFAGDAGIPDASPRIPECGICGNQAAESGQCAASVAGRVSIGYSTLMSQMSAPAASSASHSTAPPWVTR